MRKWSLEDTEGGLCVFGRSDAVTVHWPVMGRILGQFIVDALNEKEARDEWDEEMAQAEERLLAHMKAHGKGPIPLGEGSVVHIPRLGNLIP